MKLTVTAITKEQEGITKPDLIDMETFSGKNAGICYGSHGYFGTAVTDPEKALKRFETVGATGHHSVADHANVTILFEGIPKIVAMILNSNTVYATSEKSGRYTEMTGSSGIEKELYNKWVYIFTKEITDLDIGMDTKHINKLAMENARYLLSVFTPTTMSHTKNIKDWNYLIDWCEKYCEVLIQDGKYNSKFDRELYGDIHRLGEALKELLYVGELRDTKDRHLNFLALQTNDIFRDIEEEVFSEQYTAVYKASFVHLAQAQRHRTIDYRMVFDGLATEFFVPYVIKGTTLEEEWLNDISKVSNYTVPQGTLVKVIEQGTIDNFFLKCTERLCGRAQLEIATQTEYTLLKMEQHGKFTEPVRKELERYIKDGKVNTKCRIIKGGCKEPCIFGPAGALNRLV